VTTQTLEPELLESLRGAARDVLETMVFMSPKAIEVLPSPSTQFSDEVIGLLGFTGTLSGTFVLRATEQLGRTITAKMLMMEETDIGSFQEVGDAFGELVNMIGGNLKNAWVLNGNQMELSVPNVIHKGSVSIDTRRSSLRSAIRVELEGGQALEVGVHFEAGR